MLLYFCIPFSFFSFYYGAFKLLTRYSAVHLVYCVLIYPWIPLSNVSTLLCPHFSVFCQFHPSSHIFPPPSVPPSVCLLTLFTFLFFFLCVYSLCLPDHEECHTHKELMSRNQPTKNMFIQVRKTDKAHDFG